MSFNRLPKGSLVLVTGATGNVGSACVDTLLKHGYKVRAITRDVSKTAQFSTHLEKLYGPGKFEAVELKEASDAAAYAPFLEGVSGVLHIATDSTFGTNYDTVVGSVISMTVGMLEAAAKVPSVKSVVLTSSRVAVYVPQYGQDVNAAAGPNDYAIHLVDFAKSLPEDSPMKASMVYVASKIEGELAAWKWVKENNPHYAFNTVLPDLVAGPVFNPTPGNYSTHSWLNSFAIGEPSFFEAFTNPASYFVDSRDVSAIHVATLLSDTTNGERIWAMGYQTTANEVLSYLREAYPNKTFREDFDYPPAPKITIEKASADKLLKDFTGRDYYSTKESVLANVKDTLA